MALENLAAYELTRRRFLGAAGSCAGGGGRQRPVRRGAGRHAGQRRALCALAPETVALRHEIVQSPLCRCAAPGTDLHQGVSGNGERALDRPQGVALREYFRTVPLYLASTTLGRLDQRAARRDAGDGRAGHRREQHLHRRASRPRRATSRARCRRRSATTGRTATCGGSYRTEILGQPPVASHDELPAACPHYKFISNQGHLSPSYGELLRVGSGRPASSKVQARRHRARADAEKLAFLTAAEHTLAGLVRLVRALRRVPGGRGHAARSARRAAGTARDGAHLHEGGRRSRRRRSARRCS